MMRFNRKVVYIIATLCITMAIVFGSCKVAQAKIEYDIQEALNQGFLIEETLSPENVDYEYSKEGKLKLRGYFGYADSVIVPLEYNGNTVELLDGDIFKYAENLEIIKVPREIADNIGRIVNFERDEEFSNEKYVVYSTTKKYNENYLEYLKLSREEKKEYELLDLIIKVMGMIDKSVQLDNNDTAACLKAVFEFLQILKFPYPSERQLQDDLARGDKRLLIQFKKCKEEFFE